MKFHIKIKYLIISLIIISVVLLFSNSTLAKRLYFPNWFITKIQSWLADPLTSLSACDYQDGEILLIKPIATGVGNGRYEAGDIVEIRDGDYICSLFGNNDFLGKEERTQLLPVYYPKKLTQEEKNELLKPEYEITNNQEAITKQIPNLKDQNNDNKPENKMIKRRAAGVDYARFLSDTEIIKIRSFEKLDRIPEVDLGKVIDKQSGLSMNKISNDEFRILNQTQISDVSKLDNLKFIQNSEFKIQNSCSIVNLPWHLSLYEKLKAGFNNLIPFATAQVSETVKVVDPGNGPGTDYLSLNAWEAAMQDDITANDANTISVAKCRATGGIADTAAVEIDGWTTDASHYIKIWTDPNESYRHSGKWDNGKYRLIITTDNDPVLLCRESYVRIDGLQIYHNYIKGTDQYPSGVYLSSSIASAADIYISNNVIRGAAAYTNSQAGGGIWVSANHALANAYVYNNIIYDFYGSNYVSGIRNDNNNQVYAYNNTIYHCRTGVYTTIALSMMVTNNILQDAVIGYSTNLPPSDYFKSGSDYNISNITDGNDFNPGVNSYHGITNVGFADATNRDLRLAPADVRARNLGKNLSNDIYLAFTTDIEGQARGANWDIGADQFVPTPIYRSVGPGNTTALATGATNAMTISGSTATFAAGLPNNVGVGDVIQYNATSSSGTVNSLAFISGRNSATSYTVKDVAGHIASSTSANTGWSLFRAYTSLHDAVDSTGGGTENAGIAAGLRNFDTWSNGKNLASSTEQWNIAAYGDAVDSTPVTIDGWTTATSTYIKIYTPYQTSEVGTSQRHSGKWDDTKYKLVPADANATLHIMVDHTRLEGVQIKNGNNNYDLRHALMIESVENYISSNIIAEANPRTSGNGRSGIYFQYTQAGGSHVYNNIVYGFNSSGGRGIFSDANDYGAFPDYIYNNTVYNCETGIFARRDNHTVAKNNLVYNSGAGYGTYDGDTEFNILSTNNLSGPSTSDAPGSNPKNGATINFADAANKDFHLALGDNARNAGANLTNDDNLAFSADIDGESRPAAGAWDIGADEIKTSTVINKPAGAAGGLSSASGLVGYWSFDGKDMGTSTATDLSGNGNTGTLYNGVKKTDGSNGQGLSFDGVDDYVFASASASLNDIELQGGGGMTVSAWINPRSATTFNSIVAKSQTAGNVSGSWLFVIESNGGNIGTRFEKDYATQDLIVRSEISSRNFITLNTWQLVLMTWDGSATAANVKMYVNNIEVSYLTRQNGTGDKNSDDSNNFFIGNGDWSMGFDGLIDEVRVYNRTLSASEITTQYRAGAGRLKTNTPITLAGPQSGLVGNWTFNGQDMSGTTVYDRSGQSPANNGTNYGAKPTDGKVGQALSFDGRDDYINAGSAAILGNMENITISAWIYPKSGGLEGGGITIADKNEGSDLGWTFNTGPHRWIQFFMEYNTTDFARRSVDSVINFNTWQHVAVTYASGTVQTLAADTHIYINGAETSYQLSNNAVGARRDDSARILKLGEGTTLDNFHGYIDEVRVYNRALSATEIQELYKLGARKAEF